MRIYATVLVSVWFHSGLCQTIDEKYANILTTLKPDVHVDTIENCTLVLKDQLIPNRIRSLLKENVRIIKYGIKIENDSGPFSEDKHNRNTLYEPYEYVLLARGSGKLVLMLKDYFEPMSMYTLGYKTAHVSVYIMQVPEQCLTEVTAKDLEREIKTNVLTNFRNQTTKGIEVCNKHVHVDNNKIGVVKYSCCKLNLNGELVCEVLQANVYLDLFFKVILIIQIAVLMYSPLLILRNAKKIDFVHNPYNTLTLNVKVVESIAEVQGENFVKISHLTGSHFVNFKQAIQELQFGNEYSLSVRNIHLRVPSNQLVAEDESPISFTQFIKIFLFRSEIGFEIASTGTCCQENMFKMVPCCEIPWFRCLRLFLYIVVAFLLTTPWIVRVWFYYTFEENTLKQLNHILCSSGVEPANPGSLVVHLTPSHRFFIVIYCIIATEAVLYVVLPKSLKRKLMFTIQVCFKRVTDIQVLDSCGVFAANILWPLKEFGIVGLLVCPLWLLVFPLECLKLAYRVFPLLNLFMRFFINFLYYIMKTISPNVFLYRSNGICRTSSERNKNQIADIIVMDNTEDDSRRNSLIHTVALAVSILTLLVILVLSVECISFYMECAVYVVLGVMLNGDQVAKFIVLLVFIIWYTYDCLSAVSCKYRRFSNRLHKEIRKSLGNCYHPSAGNNKYEAFAVGLHDFKSDEERAHFLADKDGNMIYSAYDLFYFVKRSSYASYVPKSLVLNVANGSEIPGSAHVSYFKALFEVFLVALYFSMLLFIILLLQDGNDVSATHLIIVTISGGILPILFRKYFSRSRIIPSDYRNGALFGVVAKWCNTWEIKDLEISPCRPLKPTVTHGAGVAVGFCGLPAQRLPGSQNAFYNTKLENEQSLQEQISDFYDERISEPRTNGDLENDQIIATELSASSKNIDMIVIKHQSTPFDDDEVAIYVRRTDFQEDMLP